MATNIENLLVCKECDGQGSGVSGWGRDESHWTCDECDGSGVARCKVAWRCSEPAVTAIDEGDTPACAKCAEEANRCEWCQDRPGAVDYHWTRTGEDARKFGVAAIDWVCVECAAKAREAA